MAAHPPFRQRRRPRPGSLNRPVNSRMYRGTWLLVGIPLLISAFTVSHPQPLRAPTLQPDFDGPAAVLTDRAFVNTNPDRAPGTVGARQATSWVSQRFAQYGLRTQRERFHAKIPGRGSVQLENLLAFREGRSNQIIVVLAHRDNSGASPGANDNGSGTAALLELARSYATPRPRRGRPSRITRSCSCPRTEGRSEASERRISRSTRPTWIASSRPSTWTRSPGTAAHTSFSPETTRSSLPPRSFAPPPREFSSRPAPRLLARALSRSSSTSPFR